MNPAEFIDILQRVLDQLERSSAPKPSEAERKSIISLIGAWFSQLKPAFAAMLGDDSQLTPIDGLMDVFNKLIAGNRARSSLVRQVKAIRRLFTDSLLNGLTRAYWNLVAASSPAGYDEVVARRLKQLDATLGESYEQATLDLADSGRSTYRGAASELREVLTGVLHNLAPNEKVEATDWYREARKSGERKEAHPTRAERTRYILRSRGLGSSSTGEAEAHTKLVEDRLEAVVNANYKRGAAGTHGGSERTEVLASLQYLNALLRELLPG
ncbi:MAG: hypothetical protein A2Z21_05015 [Candidatus Fraserbacteria bacterium RBG_16_55_9]|uniref:Predicted pPIWI-associating nuclease domain-containing protein n=1 Tax=Fraserbacteria sp. (strain RBG_16_55_9) TaxID=1817864 RepID=A0A1F5V0X8_FRAXR|nr:MAG: hypothetical protein A2Z21_05015 [Candidatus Fraserbacteria bacterium RBG_16_55_9]